MNPPPPEYRDKGLGPVLAEMWKGFRVVAHNTRVLMTSATDAAKMIANGALMAFHPIYEVSVGLNPGELGLLFGMQGITSLLSKPVMWRTADRPCGRPRTHLG